MSTDTVCPKRVAEIANNLRRLFDNYQVVELRCILPGKPAFSGYFDDWGALALNALVIEEDGYACYFGLSPRDPKSCFPDNDLRPGKTASATARAKILLSDPIDNSLAQIVDFIRSS